jgi:Spy/CpxP family protein refolding chaperone
MNKKYLTIAAVVATLALAAAPFALAQRMHGGAHGGPAGEIGGVMFLGHLQQAKQALGLSDQQVSDIETIFKDLRTQNQQYRQSLHGSMQQIATTLINNPNDLATAQALLDKQTDTERQMKSNALAAASKALNVLTADQRGKLQTFLQERHSRMMQK